MVTLRETISNVIRDISDEHVALLLSDGVDSKSVYYSAIDAGKKVTAYTFFTHENKDIKGSRKFCLENDIELVEIKLPTDMDTLKEDLKVLRDLGCLKKTEYECFWPMLYVYKKVKERFIISGLGADGYFCLSKSCAIHYKHDLKTFRDKLFTDTYCQMHLHSKMNESTMIAPYLDERVKEYFSDKTDYHELNSPKQKQEIRKHYPELIDNSQHTIYQGLGISDLFKNLVESDLNIGGYKSVVGVLNLISKRKVLSD